MYLEWFEVMYYKTAISFPTNYILTLMANNDYYGYK